MGSSLKGPQVRVGALGSDPDVGPTCGEQAVPQVSAGQGCLWLEEASVSSSLRS